MRHTLKNLIILWQKSSLPTILSQFPVCTVNLKFFETFPPANLFVNGERCAQEHIAAGWQVKLSNYHLATLVDVKRTAYDLFSVLKVLTALIWDYFYILKIKSFVYGIDAFFNKQHFFFSTQPQCCLSVTYYIETLHYQDMLYFLYLSPCLLLGLYLSNLCYLF